MKNTKVPIRSSNDLPRITIKAIQDNVLFQLQNHSRYKFEILPPEQSEEILYSSPKYTLEELQEAVAKKRSETQEPFPSFRVYFAATILFSLGSIPTEAELKSSLEDVIKKITLPVNQANKDLPILQLEYTYYDAGNEKMITWVIFLLNSTKLFSFELSPMIKFQQLSQLDT